MEGGLGGADRDLVGLPHEGPVPPTAHPARLGQLQIFGVTSSAAHYASAASTLDLMRHHATVRRAQAVFPRRP